MPKKHRAGPTPEHMKGDDDVYDDDPRGNISFKDLDEVEKAYEKSCYDSIREANKYSLNTWRRRRVTWRIILCSLVTTEVVILAYIAIDLFAK